jgi:hypothetical protein
MKRHVDKRPETAPADEVVISLVYAIRDQFYREDQKQYFHSQLRDLKAAVTWPATWFNKKAIFVPAERYQEIVMNVLVDIKRHGNMDTIAYWPRYLLTCIQRHFTHDGERYYEEGKAAREVVSRLKLPSAAAPAAGFIDQLAAANAVLRSPGGRQRVKKPVAESDQKELF